MKEASPLSVYVKDYISFALLVEEVWSKKSGTGTGAVTLTVLSHTQRSGAAPEGAFDVCKRNRVLTSCGAGVLSWVPLKNYRSQWGLINLSSRVLQMLKDWHPAMASHLVAQTDGS